MTLDSGCNGCIFIQMNKRDGDPTPSCITQHMMTSIACSRKHVSRFHSYPPPGNDESSSDVL